ncbi:hypothetical protein, partial [Neglectibacter timonensis]|uniref:hypothetical protein n=1 Tax=Neglectibacter timonensis TaxID=1776382 RepID=UPI003993AE17
MRETAGFSSSRDTWASQTVSYHPAVILSLGRPLAKRRPHCRLAMGAACFSPVVFYKTVISPGFPQNASI